MNRRYLAYNPALLTDAELLGTFVVRQVDLQLIVETIRDNDGSTNQHVVVVGARGMGKTTLVSRVALAVKHDRELASRWTPVLFGEESYDVGSVGELWLKALRRLAETVGGSRWRDAFEAVRQEKDEERLRERALGRLLDHARDSGTRILLVVENLDMMLSEQIEPDDAWALRHALQQHPEIMLLATAIDYASVFGRKDLPLYGFAREHRLQPLSLGETRELWARITNEERSARAMTPIHHLTGGNPRLITIVASFSAGRPFRELMDELTELIDEHTSYFKANVEALPPVERRVYSTLADLWAPATSRQVAERCRMSVSKTSALIARLVGRRMVEEVGKEGRSKRFQLTERLYNVYHLLRSRGGEQRPRLEGLVEFMAMFYESDGLAELMVRIAREPASLPNEHCGDYFEAYKLLMKKLPDLDRAFRSTPPVFLARMFQREVSSAKDPLPLELVAATSLFAHAPGRDAAKRVSATLCAILDAPEEEVIRRLLDGPGAHVRGTVLEGLDDEVLRSYAVRLLPWLETTGNIDALVRLRESNPSNGDVLLALTDELLRTGKLDEAAAHARAFTMASPENPVAWTLLGWVLETKSDHEGAAAALGESLRRSERASTRLWLARVLYRIPGRMAEARALVGGLAFEEGDPDDWLKIAEAEDDPIRALDIAERFLATGTVATTITAFGIIVKAAPRVEGGVERFLALADDTVRAHPGSPVSLIVSGMRMGAAALTKDDAAWSMLEDLIRHPELRTGDRTLVTFVALPILALARLDPAQVLAILEAADADVTTNPVIVGLRLMLGGDVSTLPAELVAVARDIVAVLEQNKEYLDAPAGIMAQ